MKPARFAYVAPASLDEAVETLRQHGDGAKVLAGGQSLVPLMNLRLAQPSVILDLNRIEGLAYVREEGDRLAIGAMTRHQTVATHPLVRRRCPLLADAAGRIGYPAIRHRGTIGGSLAHADPVAELPCVALALGAELVAVGPDGRRTIPASEFFVTYFTTALAPTEVLTEVRMPAIAPGHGWSFQEFARKAGDFAVVGVAVLVGLAGGAVADARIALAGVAHTPIRAASAERELLGRAPDPDVLRGVAEAAAAAVDPPSNLHGSSGFRRQLVRVLTERALAEAVTRAGRTT